MLQIKMKNEVKQSYFRMISLNINAKIRTNILDPHIYTGSGSRFEHLYKIRIEIRTFILDPDQYSHIFIQDPDPGPHIYTGSGSRSAHLYWIRIQIRTFILNPDPDPYLHTGSGSISTHLYYTGSGSRTDH